MWRLHSTWHDSSQGPETRKLIIDIFEQVYLSQYIFLYKFAAMIALVHMRNHIFSLISGNGKLHFSLGVTCYKVLVTALQILVANLIEAVKLTSRL